MALPNPQTWVADELVDAAGLNTEIRDSMNFFLNRPYAWLSRTSDQSISNSTDTDIAWNSELYDTHNGHDPSTNSSRYTFQETGTYFLSASIPFATAAGGIRQVWYRVNGSTTFAPFLLDTNDNNVYQVTTQAVRRFTAGDYVEVRVRQSSGGSLAVTKAFHNGPLFSIIWLGS